MENADISTSDGEGGKIRISPLAMEKEGRCRSLPLEGRCRKV